METPSENAVIDSLYRISSLVTGTEDPGEALKFILDEITRVLQPSSASISLINPDTKLLEIEVESGLPSKSFPTEFRLGEGITGWVALHGRPLVVSDVRNEHRYIQINPLVRSEMAVPMEIQGNVIGVVNVDSERLHAFDGESLKILTLLTNEATKAVSRLWLIRQLKTKADQLQGLVNIGQQLGAGIQWRTALEYLVKETTVLLRARLGALFLANPDGKTMNLAALYDRDEGSLDYQTVLHIEDSAVGACVLFQKVVELPNIAQAEEGHFRELVRARNLHAMLACPVVAEEGVIGTLHAYTDSPRRFNNDERDLFQTVANIGAVAIQNARLYRRVFTSEELLRKNEKLTTLGMLAAEIAHEIRNPLTVIKLLFDSLDLEFAEDDARSKDATIIREKIDQLEETVGQVLNFGKNRQDMHTRCDLNALLRDTIALVRLKGQQDDIQLDFEPNPEPLMIDVNKGQIQQVVLNLLLNAMEAMDGSGGKIQVRSAAGEVDEQPCAVVWVEDNGVGIPDEIQDKIFESFLSRKQEGTGLGLAIVKRILRSHHGDITLVKTGSDGTLFKCWLPRR